MSWQPEIDELAYRKRLAAELGGPDKVKRHKDAGKLTVRERIEAIADPGSFREVGALTGSGQYDSNGRLVGLTPANLVMGRAHLGGRPAVLVGDDFTVRGGANDGAVGDKLIHAEKMAHDLRLPMVRLVDGTGGGGSVRNIENRGYTSYPHHEGVAARGGEHVGGAGGVAGAGLGGRHGRGARGGQPLLGDGQGHARNCSTPARRWWRASARSWRRTSWAAVRSTPATAWSMTRWRARRRPSTGPAASCPTCRRPCTSCRRARAPADDTRRRDEWLLSAIPRESRQVYKIRPIVQALVDQDSFFEIGHWGAPSSPGWRGWMAGPWPWSPATRTTTAAAGTAPRREKFTRFLDMAEAFHLPVVNLGRISPGSRSGWRPRRPGSCVTACARWRRFIRPPCRGAR